MPDTCVLGHFIVLDGPVVAPLFERLERELETLRPQQSAANR